jgi:predicted peroxiredoxin
MTNLLYQATAGFDDPTRAGMPFHMAGGAVEAGVDCAIVLAGDATVLMIDAVADALLPLGMPPFKELLARVVQANVPIYV